MKIKILLAVVLTVSLNVSSHGQKNDRKLKSEIEKYTKDFRGTVGVYVRHLQSGVTVMINADTIFPTASMVKIPITVGMFDKIDRGDIPYDTVLTYKDSLLYAGEDILGSFKHNEKVSLGKVMMLMITTSDNTASLWCQTLAGTGVAINQILEREGFKNTRVNSRTAGREANRSKFGWGQTTPREMAELLVKIREGKMISPRASERMYRNLIRIYWDSEALSQIPPYVQAASKQGAVDRSRSEVVLVNAPHGDYVFCVITKNQEDTSWKSDNAGFVLIRNISRTLWKYFEPDSQWVPAPGIEEWY
jgi:beta-lactamase class A